MRGITFETPLETISGIGQRLALRFKKLGLSTVRDVLWHFPTRYEDYTAITPIADLEPGVHTTVQGIIEDISMRRTWKRHMVVVEATIADDTGKTRAIWFNQPYVKNYLRTGIKVNLSGKVAIQEGEPYLAHPTYEIVRGNEHREQFGTAPSAGLGTSHCEPTHTGRLVPVYPETRGLTSKGIRAVVAAMLPFLDDIDEWLPDDVLSAHYFPHLSEALRIIHFPDRIEDTPQARKRFAFEELFLLQLHNVREKARLKAEKARPLSIDIEEMRSILSALPFELTHSQKQSLWDTLKDIAKESPMNRLLQGDVGSGKTVVALLAAFVAAESGHQAAIMAPTEVLARQHFETVKKMLSAPAGKNKTLETFASRWLPAVFIAAGGAEFFYGDGLEYGLPKKRCAEMVANGEVKIVIGTHALIQRSLKFNDLSLVVIDEQHRFGVRQRQALLRNANTDEPIRISRIDPNDTNGIKILFKELSYKLTGIFFKIQQELGRFGRERQYADALEQVLQDAQIPYSRELPIAVGGRKSNFADFIVDGKILIELKAKNFITKDDYSQIMRYLHAGNLELGMLVNFHQEHLKPKRVLNSHFSDNSDVNSDTSNRVFIPHFLSMSATPIPRTLMLTMFGDLDLSLITELPKGRKKILTKIVAPENRKKAYEFIREKIREGRQAFVICPRIEPPTNADQARTNAGRDFPNEFTLDQCKSAWNPRESAVLETKAVKEEFEKLSKNIFPDLRVAMLHGKMSAKEKEKIMKEFKAQKSDILVSTSVIEVGVDVPNTAIMMIEGADHFGLAQLYQFRGRVGRGEHQSYCFLFTDSPYKKTRERLQAIVDAKSGFELAEADLKLRGPGEFLGSKQTGLPDVAMQSLQDPELIKESRQVALRTLTANPTLSKYPRLKDRLSEFEARIHQE